MKTLILFLLVFTFSGFKLDAQSQKDTIGIHSRKFEFYYQGQTIKRIRPLQEILLAETVLPQVEQEWNKYITAHRVGIGMELAGLGVSAVGLARQLKGESNNLLLPGAIILVGGLLVDAFVATRKAKLAVRRYNDLNKGRLFSTPLSSPAEKGENSEGARRKLMHLSGAYYGLTLGTGWSKQKINYEFALDQGYQPASVFSIALQYGRPLSAQLGWQLELGLTEHGYRVEQNSSSSGVRIMAKADIRVRYLELPFSLTYRLPVGNKHLEVLAMPGLNVGYALSGRMVAHGKGENETRKVNTKVVDQLSVKDAAFSERLDAALLLGTQTVFHFGPGSVFAETRYNFGVWNMEPKSEFSITDGRDKAFNRTLLLRLGYRYAL